MEKEFRDEQRSNDCAATPEALRVGVREGILQALELDRAHSGASAVRKLTVAGAAGVAGAVAMTVLFSGSSVHLHHPLHLAICGAAWAGLLVLCSAFVLLRLRTPRIHLAQVASLGLVGLGIAALAALCCPASQFLHWWTSTTIGAGANAIGGLPGSALALGLLSAFLFGLVASLLTHLKDGLQSSTVPSMFLLILLLPAVILQSVGTQTAVLIFWTLGTAIGSYAGVAGGKAIGSFARKSPV